jgi:hypothetical protein
MEQHLVIAIVAATINFLLSLILPILFKDTKLPILTQIKQNYECNQKTIITSTILVVIFVYVSLKITPWLQTNVFTALANINSYENLVKERL